MPSPCPECGGDLMPRASGFLSCHECGKLVVTPKGNDQDLYREEQESAELATTEGIEVPDFIECMIGWRAWGIDPETPAGEIPVLRSVSHATCYWTPGAPMEATCSHSDDHVPGEQCGCGLYSAKTLEHLMSMRYHTYDAERGGLFHVIGEVSLWGKVIEGSQGWRAQFGYPRTLYVPYEAWSLASRLEDGYGVPVRLKNILREPEGAER